MKANVDVLKLLVVVDVKNPGGLQVDTFKSGELGICNQDLETLGDRCCEFQSFQGRKGNPVDGADFAELRATQGLKNDQAMQLHLPRNGS